MITAIFWLKLPHVLNCSVRGPPQAEEMPTGVVAIKMRPGARGNSLQEGRSVESHGCKYTHPENMVFGADYFENMDEDRYPSPRHQVSSDDVMDHVTVERRDTSPNANNNNSEGEMVMNDSVPHCGQWSFLSTP